jgi:uncharacterized iron-regulated protein
VRGAAIVLLASVLAHAAAASEADAPCTSAAAEAGWKTPAVRAGDTAIGFDAFIEALAGRRVVFVGEQHDRYEQHLNQLEIICRLLAGGDQLAIGAEFFQQSYQAALDDYVAGAIDLDGLLERSSYFSNWGFDFRLYAPILRFARAHHLAVVALNIPSAVSRAVAQGGFGALSEAQRRWVPADIDRSDADYRKRLRAVFEQHPEKARGSFEHFVDAQLLWDEAMAERAARYLRDHPHKGLVVLAGVGHIAFGSGIPNRLARRVDATMVTVLQSAGHGGAGASGAADFRLLTEPMALPPAGKLGVIIETTDAGVVVQAVADNSGARAAGVKVGDRILAVGERPVERFDDVKIVLWDKPPGETVMVRVQRPSGEAGAPETLDLPVRLH